MDKKITEMKETGDIKGLIDELKEGDIEERAESAMALGVLEAEEAVGALVDSLDDESDLVVSNAALALGHIGSDEVMGSLLDRLDHESWEVRHDAAIALGEIGTPDAEDELLELLDDEEMEVRQKAVEALGKVGDEETLEELKGHIGGEDIRKELVWSISLIGGDGAVEPLIELYEDGGGEIRKLAVRGMGKVGGEGVKEMILEATEDKNWRVREEAAKALNRVFEGEKIEAGSRYVEKLIELLDDEKIYVVKAALRTLGELGDEGVLPEVKERVEDDEPSIRSSAVEAVGRLGGKEAVELLLGRLERETNPRVLWSISDALSMVDEEGVEEMEERFDQVPEKKKIIVAVALGKNGSRAELSYLLEGMRDDRWKIRQKSAEGIRGIGPKDFNKRELNSVLSRSREGIEDNDKWVRMECIKALGEIIEEVNKDTSREREKLETLLESGDEDEKEAVEKVLEDIEVD